MKPKQKKKQNAQSQKSYEKSLSSKMDFRERTIGYCLCTCHRYTLVFGIRKAWTRPIGACEIDGLPEASMAVLSRTRIH